MKRKCQQSKEYHPPPQKKINKRSNKKQSDVYNLSFKNVIKIKNDEYVEKKYFNFYNPFWQLFKMFQSHILSNRLRYTVKIWEPISKHAGYVKTFVHNRGKLWLIKKIHWRNKIHVLCYLRCFKIDWCLIDGDTILEPILQTNGSLVT